MNSKHYGFGISYFNFQLHIPELQFHIQVVQVMLLSLEGLW